MDKRNRSKRAAIIFMVGTAVVTLRAQTFTTIASFSSTTSNGHILGPITQGTDGNFYGAGAFSVGVTGLGSFGAACCGTVFKITPQGVLTVLHSFSLDATEGVGPTGLIQATDGNFYGTTGSGGGPRSSSSPGCTLGCGTVFKVTPTGTLTTLYNFSNFSGPDGAAPMSTLTQSTDGNFYGTTAYGGTYGLGTVFKISPAGTLNTLYSFGGSPTSNNGFNPAAALAQGADGSFYGMTNGGFGTIFKITASGALTTLHSFDYLDDGVLLGFGGSLVYPPLVQSTDGSFYGTGQLGPLGTSPGSPGMVFKISPGGAFTILHVFSSTGTDGAYPIGLIRATDGNFYGGTADGKIFKITPAGAITTLHDFGNGLGTPIGFVQATDGNIFGVTLNSFFRLTLASQPSSAAPTITSGGIVPVYSTATTIQSGEWISIYGANLANGIVTWTGNFPTSLGGTSVTINGKSAYLWFVSPSQINLQAPDDTAIGTVPVVVNTASGSSTSTVTLAQFGPSFSLLDSKHVAGIILRPNGSGAYGSGAYDIIGPTGSSLGYSTVAAQAGDTVELFGVGFGATIPPVSAGEVFSGSAATANPVRLLINNISVTPTFAGLSSAGLYQINLTVPTGLAPGDVSLQAFVGGTQTPSGVVISLQ